MTTLEQETDTLVLTTVSKRFGTTQALRDINLTIHAGEFFAIVGPSGCGKSTLLRLIAGLEHPDGGDIVLDGRRMNGVDPADRDVGMVFQNYALYPHLSVFENLAFGLRVRKVRKDEIQRRVREVARFLGIEELLARRSKELSGGQRQRVALGRALVRRPKVLLMDEPLSNVDALLRDKMRVELRRLHEETGVTTLYVTHDQREALSMADRLLVLDDGRVQQVGTPFAVFQQPETAFVARFIGTPGMNLWTARVRAQGAASLVVQGPAGAPWTLPAIAPTGGVLPADVQVGVRPERLRVRPPVGDAVRLDGLLELIEPVGEDALLRVRYGADELTAYAPPEDVPPVGAPLALYAAPTDLYFFGVDDGRRLAWDQRGEFHAPLAWDRRRHVDAAASGSGGWA